MREEEKERKQWAERVRPKRKKAVSEWVREGRPAGLNKMRKQAHRPRKGNRGSISLCILFPFS